MVESDGEWQQLLPRVRDGDEAACHEVWVHYGPLIERVAERNPEPHLP